MAVDEQEFAEFVTKCSELALYFVINDCGGLVWRLNHEINAGRLESTPGIQADILRIFQRGKLGVSQTVRFGVSNPWCMKKSPFDDRECEVPSDEYWLWFRWWDFWLKALSSDEFKLMDADLSRAITTPNVDLSKWRPAGNWRDPAETLAK